MEKFYINTDGSVDVVIDISKNEVVTLSGDLFREVANRLEENNALNEEAKNVDQAMSDARQRTKETNEMINNLFE